CLPGFPLPASGCRGAAGPSGPVAEGNRSYKESSMGWTPVRTKLVLLVGLSLLAGAAPPGADPNNPPVPDPPQAAEDAALRQLTDELEKVVALLAQAKGPAEVVRYNLRQADLIVRISNRSKPEERESWLRQLADCLSAAAQSSPANDRTAYQRLVGLEEY